MTCFLFPILCGGCGGGGGGGCGDVVGGVRDGDGDKDLMVLVSGASEVNVIYLTLWIGLVEIPVAV